RQFRFAVLADQQPVIGVERIGAALLQPPQQAILQKMRAARVEVHAALLIHQRLQQPQFRIRQDRSRCRSKCAHSFSRSPCPTYYILSRRPAWLKPNEAGSNEAWP